MVDNIDLEARPASSEATAAEISRTNKRLGTHESHVHIHNLCE